MMFGKKDKGNGHGDGESPLSVLDQLLAGKGPVRLEVLQEAKKLSRTDRARMVIGLGNSLDFHALIYEILDAATSANRSGQGKFVGADELLGALNVVFAMLHARLPVMERTGERAESPAKAFGRKMLAAILGRHGNRQWKQMTDRPKSEWNQLEERLKDLEELEAKRT